MGWRDMMEYAEDFIENYSEKGRGRERRGGRELEEAFKEGWNEGYECAIREFEEEGYGERGGSGGSGGSGGGSYGARGGSYGERRGVRGTGPYSRYRR